MSLPSNVALDTDNPTGGEMISTIDDMIKGDRYKIDQVFRAICGYPRTAYVRIPVWSNSTKPDGQDQRPSPQEGFMGFNTDLKKFEYYNGSGWQTLEYAAETAGSCTGNSATATKATNDVDGNPIKTTYVKQTEVQIPTGENSHNGKIVKFTNSGHIQFPNGGELWVV